MKNWMSAQKKFVIKSSEWNSVACMWLNVKPILPTKVGDMVRTKFPTSRLDCE